ncbi:MAG: metal ABC transporter solute-binding protein, Zn/Mn family [Marmoricola sp.]
MNGRAKRTRVRIAVAIAAALVGTGALSACNASGGPTGGSSKIAVAASINAWGSILSQLGGDRVQAVSIITNPATDPHSYEPTPADGRTIAVAQLFVENGIGYDSWADKALAASPNSSRQVINVGTLVGVPDGGNPHRWYSPSDVEKVADAITTDLKKIDPNDAAYFDAQRATFDSQGLAKYHSLISEIRAKYSGVQVGASESIFAPLAQALNLDLVTPPSFLKAISEGTDPSPADKTTVDNQIATRKIKVYVFNTQNSTPDVAAQVAAAKAKGIPVVGVTETLSPANATFETWQVAQLEALAAALHKATGR